MPQSKRPLGVLIAMLGVIVAFAAFASPAYAAYSDPTKSSISDETPGEGGTCTLSGSGFGADEDISNVLHSLPMTLAPARSNASGQFSVSVKLPMGVTGVHTITSTGATSGHVSSITITIGGTAAAGAGTSTLAFTGAAVIGIGSLAILLLVGGGVMMLAGRRRKATR